MGGSDRETDRRGLWRAAVAVAVGAGACAVVAGSLLWHRALVQDNRHVVQAAAKQARTGLSSTLLRYTDLVMLTGQQLGSAELGPPQFNAEFQQARIGERYPGMIGIGFVSYVPARGLAGFAASEQAAGEPAFAVTPAGTRPFYCLTGVADWVPGVPRQALAGYDFCSIPWVRAALMASARSGSDGVVPERKLANHPASEFVLFSPYYSAHSPAGTAPGTSIVGWSAALVNGAELLRSVGLSAHASSAVTLFSGLHATAGALVASSGRPRGAVAGTDTARITAGGTWTVRTEVLTGYPGLVPAWTVPLLVLTGGLVLLAAVACLGWMLVRGRRRAEQAARRSRVAMQRSEARFESIAAASPIGIVETTESLEITYLNPRLEAIAGRPAAELLGTSWMQLLHPDDRAPFLARAGDAARDRRELAASVRVLRPSGEVRTVRVLAAALGLADAADAHHYVASIEDVSEEIALQEQLRHQALHDDLTGLPNRTLFLDRLQQAIQQSSRSDLVPAILFLDLDRFKVVNDSLGHKAGDKLLIQLADRLRAATRGGETVARLGGDEFAVLLPEVTGSGAAIAVAKRIMHALDAPFDLQGRNIVASVSVGIMLAGARDDPGTVLRGADAAMYRAKERGRGRYAVFQEGFHEHSLRQLTLEGEIRDGMRERQFEVFYQPVVDLRSGAMIGAEALLRWHHPRRGLLEPAHFIPVAEECGLIVPLGQWAFAAAVAQVASFDDDPDSPHLETIAINLSSHQLRSPHLARERQAAIRQHGIEANRICLELTETLVMDHTVTTTRFLQQMSERGTKVAIDDFGTGYSSLAYLQTLPVSIVKIDRRFIARVGTDPDAGAIVAAIIEMAHRLGLQVVAEGVEEDVQRQALVDLGCEAAQGYLWARPMPADELRVWCRDRDRSLAPSSPGRTPR